MELMLDTADLEEIKYYNEIFPIVGVTSNPSILKKEGNVNFFEHLRKIRDIIGMDKSLHVQVTTNTSEQIIEEANKIAEEVGKDIYIKIPINEEGLKAIKVLKKDNFRITGTAIYTSLQGDLAIMAGADYIAPYYNRMENADIDPKKVINHYSRLIKMYNKDTKILAASFRNVGQIIDAYDNGAHCATVDPNIIKSGLQMPSIELAVQDFIADWEEVHGKNKSILDL